MRTYEVGEPRSPVSISTLSDLKIYLGHVCDRGYHIDFDREGRVIAMVYPQDYSRAIRAALRMVPGACQNMRFRKISWWKRFGNWITRRVFR